MRLANNIADNGIRRKSPHFVEYWRDSLRLELLRPAGKLHIPELPHHHIVAVADRLFAEFFIRQHAGDIEHGRLGPIEQCQNSIAQNIFQPRPPTVAKHPLEHTNHL